MNPDQSPSGTHLYSRRSFVRLGVATAALTIPGSSWSTSLAATKPGQRIVVDLASELGSPNYAATGFLHGLNEDGTEPPDRLLLPLRPRLFRGSGSVLPGGGWGKGGYEGYAVRWQSSLDRYNRVARLPSPAEYDIVMSDLWGAEGVTLSPTDPYPGDDDDWSSWEAFLRQLVHDVQSAAMDPNKVRYEIWNEPDFSKYWPRPREQYEEAWRRAVRFIRSHDPAARIVGPTFTQLVTTGWPGHMDEWLDMVVESGTAPDILAWHTIWVADQDPVAEARLARRLLTERGLGHVQLEVNEYPAPVEGSPHWVDNGSRLSPGNDTWWIARLQRARIDYAALAIYGECCYTGLLDDLLTVRNGTLETHSRWWAYERYGSITGTLVATKPSQDRDVDAVAGADPEERRVRAVLGNRFSPGSTVGPVRVTIEGLGEARDYLANHGRVRVRLERIPKRQVLDAPIVVDDYEVVPEGDEVTLTIDWENADDSYVVTLGEHETELPPYAIVEVTPTNLVVPREYPVQVTVRLRNYTSSPVTVQPQVTVPSGYTTSAPDSVTIPADSDADFSVTVVRTTAELTPGELHLTVGDASATVTLEPTDNLVRVAGMAASSSYGPSSPDNLNDGRTDSEEWGGGGANGWNDNTAGVWPDTVTATWASPVPISRVRVYTLDSSRYSASSFGVRDYDLQVRVGNTFQTVAQVRDNVLGTVESRFDLVDAAALRIVIHDSNDHAYSRLVEIEGYTE